MCHCDRGTSVANHLVQSYLNLTLGLVVERCGGFVQEQQLRISKQGPGDASPLLLTARESCALRTAVGVEGLRQLVHELHQTLFLDSSELLVSQHLARDGHGSLQVLAQRCGKQHGFLFHEGHCSTKGGDMIIANVLAVDEHRSTLWVVETHQQLDDGALPRTRFATDSQLLSLLHSEGYVLEHLHIRTARVGEAHVPKLDVLYLPYRRHLVGEQVASRALDLLVLAIPVP
mmetsp:Transcript_53743/g.143807  ORF Transcript_53743/g.143807 Transcript_53743/m.143807 type:complete len:231 (+) Transcript_53743:2444-3136(+)